MIKEFVAKFDAARPALLAQFKAAHPAGYTAIVRAVVRVLHDGYGTPNPERIHRIDDGDYRGTLLFVIVADGSRPSIYWAVKIGYGSCSGCDTFAAIRGTGLNYNNAPTDEQAAQYLTLALHVVQGLREVCAFGDGDGNE